MKASLRVRLIAAFLLVTTLLAGVGLLILGHARMTTESYQRSLSDLVSVAELSRAVDQGALELGRLVIDRTPDQAAEAFKPTLERVYRLRTQLPPATVNPASARLVADLDNMADSFLVSAGAAIYALRAGDLEAYFRHDRDAAIIAGYVRATADRLLADELDVYRGVFPEAIRRDRQLQTLNLFVLTVLTLGTTVFAWSFARGVTDPLETLSRLAGRIAAGHLDGPPVPAGSGDELEVLSRAFNRMQENLRRHVTDLEQKAELERAELRALQSQVNPHFLFNTLNMVAKMALIEGAERTRTLLETVADLLRYSLRDLDRPVILRDEVVQVGRYMTIQGERFRDRIRFEADCDEAALGVLLPCLTLQPLVENALIHGIGGREHGGVIRLTARREAGAIRVAVADDGLGISTGRFRQLTSGAPGPDRGGSGHTTGLGLQNVRRRLELFYGGGARMTITSEPGRGTTVTLLLPESHSDEVITVANPGGGR